MPASFPPPTSQDPVNPYAAPTSEIGESSSVPDALSIEAEAIRRAHIGPEATTRLVGELHFVAAFVGMVFVVGLIFTLYADSSHGRIPPWEVPALYAGIVVFPLISGFHVALGIGLRNLGPWARWTEVALTSLLMLIFVAIVTAALYNGSSNALNERWPSVIANLVLGIAVGIVFFFLISKKCGAVFSPDYREIIARTSNIRPKTRLSMKLIGFTFTFLVALISSGVVLALIMLVTRYLWGIRDLDQL